MSKTLIRPALTLVGAAVGTFIAPGIGTGIGATLGEAAGGFVPGEGPGPSFPPPPTIDIPNLSALVSARVIGDLKDIFEGRNIVLDLAPLAPPLFDIVRGEEVLAQVLQGNLSSGFRQMVESVLTIPKSQEEFWDRAWVLLEATIRDLIRITIDALGKHNKATRLTLDLIFRILLTEFRTKSRPGEPIPRSLEGMDFGELTPELKPIIEAAGPEAGGVLGEMGFGIGELAKSFGIGDLDPRGWGPAIIEWLFSKAAAIFQSLPIPSGEAILDTAAAPFRLGASALLGATGRALDRITPVEGEDVNRVAVDLLGEAMLAGIVAHLSAFVPELFYPTKHLGFQQLSGLISDFGAFKPMVDAVWGTRLRAALGRPAEHAANKFHRGAIPGSRDILLLFANGFLLEPEAKELLARHGLSDQAIEALILDIPREPSVRELILAVEDSEVDDAWVTRMLREAGYDDEGQGNLLRAIRLASTKGQRQALISDAVRAYIDGALNEEELVAELDGAEVSEANRALVVRRARITARRERLSGLLEVYRTQARAFLIPLDEFESLVEAMGLTSDVEHLVVALESAKVKGKLFLEERAELRAVARQTRATQGRATLAALKRGTLEPAQAESNLLAFGFLSEQARALVDLTEVERRPIPIVPRPLTREAEEELATRSHIEATLIAVRRGILPASAGVANLLTLGVLPERAEALVRVEEVRSFEPPKVIPTDKPTPEELAVRRIKTDALLEAFEAGEVPVAALEDRLVALGHDRGTAKAIREREEGRAARKSARVSQAQSEREAAAKLREERAKAAKVAGELDKITARKLKLLERETLLALRKGFLSPEQAQANLVVLGVDPAEAETLISIEFLQAFRPGPSVGIPEEEAT